VEATPCTQSPVLTIQVAPFPNGVVAVPSAWFGTRGSEVQILSPRPIFLSPIQWLRSFVSFSLGSPKSWTRSFGTEFTFSSG